MGIILSQTTKRLDVHDVRSIAVSDIVKLPDGKFLRQLHVTTSYIDAKTGDKFEAISALNLFSAEADKTQLALFEGEES